jgi:hypothetical protein
MISESQRLRKLRSEAILEQEGVPFIDHLPVVEDERTAEFRTLEEVAWRAMALNIVSVKGEGLDQTRVLEIVEQYGLELVLTPKEKEFILNDVPSEHDRIQFSWRYEAYWVLLWALGYVEALGRPDEVCDVPRAVSVMVGRDAEEFIRDAKLRRADVILDAVDLIYRYHWACRDASLNGRIAPAELNPSVVVERHHALNWLVGYGDNAEWDDVTTDT